ncbi:MAG: hypothetical protein ACOVN7_15110 [Rubrivivax sp.]
MLSLLRPVLRVVPVVLQVVRVLRVARRQQQLWLPRTGCLLA